MAHQFNLLIVDDEPDIVEFLADHLKARGYTILTAHSGEQALNLVEAERPDLILLDVVMPGMNGYDVCRRIRKNPITTLLPIVMMTGLEPDERLKSIEVGADDFVTKPINTSELFARIRSLLRIKDLHDVVQTQAIQLGEWNKELQAKLEQEAKLAEVTRMLGDIGHDVKNWLMPVLNGAGLLQEELDDLFKSLPAQGVDQAKTSKNICQEIIDMVRRSAQRIQEQVRDIADCVKGLSTPLKLSPCHLLTVVETVMKTLQIMAAQKGVTLQTKNLESLPLIQADDRRMFKAFYNLIDNAVAEMPDGGTITVQGTHNVEAQQIDISVTDTGRGMPPDVRDSLFTPHVVSRKTGGTGLGTKIVKDVVDAHHGHISVTSEVGVGTTFHLQLPIKLTLQEPNPTDERKPT